MHFLYIYVYKIINYFIFVYRLAHYWKIPAIVLCSVGTNKWTNEMVGNPHSPAYNPSIFLGYTDKMSLKERLINTLASAFEKITYKYKNEI